jgi:hypothetical protein
MSGPNDHRKFRQQYNKAEWAKLEANLGFKEALAADDLSKAGLLADRILKGEARSLGQAKEQKRRYDTFREFDPE